MLQYSDSGSDNRGGYYVTNRDSHLEADATGWPEISSHASEQSPMYNLLTICFSIYHLMFSDCSRLQVTETWKAKPQRLGNYYNTYFVTLQGDGEMRRGDHFTTYINIESLCWIPETNIVVYINYI